MALETNNLYEFENFRLDLTEKTLLRDGKFVPITPKVFETLQVFVENAGRLVEKDELMRKLWPGLFVEESNLSFNIKMLRKALGDNAQKPRFIETVPKRGFRFIAEVSRGGEEAGKVRRAEVNENAGSVAGFPLATRQSPTSGAVVALADWRHVPDESEREKTAPEHTAVAAKLELLPGSATVKGRRTYYLLALAGLMCAMGLILFGLYSFTDRAASTADLPRSAMTRVTSNGKTKLAALSPDGKFVAYVLDDEEEQSLWLKNVAAGSDVEILPAGEAGELNNLTFSPDGNHVYYSAKGVLYQLPILGGVPKRIVANLVEANSNNPVSFSPDGKQFTFVRRSNEGEEIKSLVISDVDGTDERVLATSRRPDIFWGSAAWSPDGKVIAVTAIGKILTVRVADGVVSTISSGRFINIFQVLWHPDGSRLLAVASEGRSTLGTQVWSLSYSGGEERNLFNDLTNYSSISLTADGNTLVAIRTEQTAFIWMMSSEETRQGKQLTNGIDRYDGCFGLNYLSDGRIIYDTAPRDGDGEAWTIYPDGRSSKQTSDEGGSTGVSPDGKYLVFQSGDGADTGLFRLNPDDGTKLRLTTGIDLWATFSPDGEWVIFTRWAEQVALWKVSISGGEAIKLTNVAGLAFAPAVSPDGKQIAFYWKKLDRDQQPEIALLPIEGGEVINTFKIPFQYPQGAGKKTLQWTPDAQAINYVYLRDNVSNIWRQPLNGSPAVQVTNFESGLIFNFAYSPNGKQLALSRGTFNRDVVLISNVN